MSNMGWVILLLIKYLCIYSSKTLKLGGMMLLLSLSMSMLMSMKYLSWLSLMFFIIYVGGLLVLFFYLSSLKYNPMFSLSRLDMYSSSLIKIKSLILLGLVALKYMFSNNDFSFNKDKIKNYSTNLFKNEEFQSMVLVGIMLLMVLWLVTKLTFKTRGALRPTF